LALRYREEDSVPGRTVFQHSAGAVLLMLLLAACPEADAPSWPPSVDAGAVRRVTEDNAAAPPKDGEAVDRVRLGFITGMDFDRKRGRLLIAQKNPDMVIAVGRDGRLDVLVDADTELPELGVNGLDSERLSDPGSVGAGPEGTVFFTEDELRSVVRAVGPKGRTRTVAGGHASIDAPGNTGRPLDINLDVTVGLAVGGDGTVYVSDAASREPGNRVWAVSPDGRSITKLFGDGGTLGEGIQGTPRLAADGDVLWVVPDPGGEPSTEFLRVDVKARKVDRVARRERGPSRSLAVVAAPDGVFVTDEQGAVWHLGVDGRAERLLTPQQLGGAPASATALAFDGERLYVAGGDSLSLFRPPDLDRPAR